MAQILTSQSILLDPLLHMLQNFINDLFMIANQLNISTTTAFLWVMGFLVAWALYYLLFTPMNRIRDLSDVGYSHALAGVHEKGKRRRDLVNDIRRKRNVGTLPPVFPNGWFTLLESDDLKTGQVKPVSALGENLAVFRGESGQAYILDAYCSHLGAHLGVGGRVEGDCLECPFHAWLYRGEDGKCTSIPYASKVPDFARVKTWPSFEANGFIYIWYHAENLEPNWWPVVIPEIAEGKWTFKGRTEFYVNCHIEDIPENGADIAHLSQLHKPSMLAGGEPTDFGKWLWSFMDHRWDAKWEPHPPPESHVATMTVDHEMRVFNKLRLFSMSVQCNQTGPGFVDMFFNTTLGMGIMFHAVTPVEPLVQRVVHRLYTSPTFISPYAKIVLQAEALMIERDMMVWNNKTYIQRPLLVKEDRAILRHRRWYSQFYSDNSPRFTFRRDTMDW